MQAVLERSPATTAPLLALEGVSKLFGRDTLALDGFGLALREGELVSLLGPSGCGKSTALRIAAGLVEPTRGRVAWGDPAVRDDLGVVFQDPTLMPWATVADNVWLPLRLRGRSRADARDEIARAVGLVGLDGFEGAYPRELSGGMRMRVSIARAFVTRPRLILMDEPFAALDEITRHRLNHDLLAMREAVGATILFVTHSVFESVFLSTRIAVMGPRPGRVVAEVPIAVPHPREEAFRTSPEYATLCREVSAALTRAMAS